MKTSILCLALAGVLLAAPNLDAAELVMVEEPGCPWCARWNDEVGHVYPRTSEGRAAPLRRVDIRERPSDFQYAQRVVYTPTFVLIDNGQELGRIEGYGGDAFFWALLGKLLTENDIDWEDPS